MGDRPKLLFQGYRGAAVKECKERMKKLGFYSGPIDDNYNYEIAGAAVKLQQQEKIKPVNGGFFDACWEALDRLEAAAAKTPPKEEPARLPPPGVEPEPKAPQPKAKAKPRAPDKLPPPGVEPEPPKPPPPPPPAKQPAGELRLGAGGVSIAQLQKWLAACGYSPGGADGVYGQMTALAVQHFQATHGLTANGKADAATLAALEQAAGTVSPPSGPAKVTHPGAAKAPLFDSTSWVKTRKPSNRHTMRAHAPSLEGKDVFFAVFVLRTGVWERCGVVKATVKNGDANAEVPANAPAGEGTFLRFQVFAQPPAAAA